MVTIIRWCKRSRRRRKGGRRRRGRRRRTHLSRRTVTRVCLTSWSLPTRGVLVACTMG